MAAKSKSWKSSKESIFTDEQYDMVFPTMATFEILIVSHCTVHGSDISILSSRGTEFLRTFLSLRHAQTLRHSQT